MISAKVAALVAMTGAGLAAAGTTASAPGPSIRTLQTSAPVSALTADGGLVAVETRPRAKACSAVIVWDARRRTSTRWSTHTNCAGSPGLPYLAPGEDELALAGTRVAWLETIAVGVGEQERTTLWTATLREPRARKLATAEAGAGSDTSGRYLGNLHGAGSLLGFNRWTSCEQGTDHPGCSPGAPRSPSLYRIDSASKAALVPDVENARLTWVDGGRLATGYDPIQLVDGSGRLLRSITTGPQDRHGLALSGTQLVVSTGRTLQVYDTRTGSLARTWPVVSYAGVVASVADLQDGIALYFVARQVHVLRIADGRDRTLAVSQGHLVGAQIEKAGVWFAYNTAAGHGRVVFVPWSSVRSTLG